MYTAFISSPVKGLNAVREEIHQIKLPDGRQIYIDELDHPRHKGEPPFVTIKDLFDRIRNTPEFIVILATPRHGSSLQIGNHKAHTSYWEAELFYALLLLKEVHVLEVDGFLPEPKLAAILNVLKASAPKKQWLRISNLQMLPLYIKRIILARLKQSSSPNACRLSTLRHFIDGIFRVRGLDGRGGAAETESLQFFEGTWSDSTVTPNLELTRQLLTEVNQLANEQERLARLWIAFRELSGFSLQDYRKSTDSLPLWDTFLGEWSRAGSWYGLHGHPNLAVLPALVNQASIRSWMRKNRSNEWRHCDLTYPGGSLASARYSIARRAYSPFVRRFLLNAALADMSRAEEEGENPSNHFLIRGSVYMQKGAFWAAVREYEAAVSHCVASGATDEAMGVAISELGFGRLFQLRWHSGIELLEEGVHLLSKEGVRLGFLIRAQRKLSIAYALTGRIRKAKELRTTLRNSAKEHMVLDQLR